MGGWENVKQLRLLAAVAASDDVRQQFTTLFDYGVFDKFPPLKIVVLESGTSWIGYWLDRIDAVFTHTFIGDRVPLKHKPSDYFVLNVSTFATSLPLGFSRQGRIGVRYRTDGQAVDPLEVRRVDCVDRQVVRQGNGGNQRVVGARGGFATRAAKVRSNTAESSSRGCVERQRLERGLGELKMRLTYNPLLWIIRDQRAD